MTDSELIVAIRKVLFPEGDEDHECGAEEIGEVCNLLLTHREKPPILSGDIELLISAVALGLPVGSNS